MERLDEHHQFSTKALYDIKLVERALKNDDQKAYEEFMKRYWEPVYFMLLRMTYNNTDNAEDLTMESFGKAFKYLDKYTTNFAFSTWLFKIASNNAIDFIRHNKAQKGTLSLSKAVDTEGGSELGDFVRTIDLNPEDSIIRRQNIDNIRSIIEKLKPNYREIVELFYIEELSNEQISKRVGLPVATVKVRLFRARELLLSMAKRHNIR
ncbi:MAG TPA: sigma-70 family RNA polymerase sigma factor [Bacteroidia bacterium]